MVTLHSRNQHSRRDFAKALGLGHYNLKDDPGETKNLASAIPPKVKELSAVTDRFVRDTRPEANPKFNPGTPSKGKKVTLLDLFTADDMA